MDQGLCLPLATELSSQKLFAVIVFVLFDDDIELKEIPYLILIRFYEWNSLLREGGM